MFVNQIVYCNSEDLAEDLIKVQITDTYSRHPKPCRPCKFGIPCFPMDRSRLLLKKWKEESNKKLKDDFINTPPHFPFSEYVTYFEWNVDMISWLTAILKPK